MTTLVEGVTIEHVDAELARVAGEVHTARRHLVSVGSLKKIDRAVANSSGSRLNDLRARQSPGVVPGQASSFCPVARRFSDGP